MPYRMLAVLLSMMIAGCATQRSWVYKTNPYAAPSAARKQKVVVLPFQDARKNENTNLIPLYLIPVFPFGWANYEVPEGATQHVTSGLWTNYKPTEDYPKALADELRASGLFGETYFDFKEGDADLAARGTIVNTRYQGKIFSYGLSAYGPMLWFIGLPAATASNELVVELTLDDLKAGRRLLTKHYEAPKYGSTSWLYVMKNDFNYPDMLADIYRRFVDDIRREASIGVAGDVPVVPH
jgi:hypothetical protein